jgi:starch synthase
VLAALGPARTVWAADELFGGPGRVLAGRAAGLDLLVVEAPHLYDREGAIYLGPGGADWPDNPERFAALSWAAAAIAAEGAEGWRPAILHAHDWQAGLAPLYLSEQGGAAASVITIHNVAFQGLVPAWRLNGLRLPPGGMGIDGFEYWGQISALKAGLVWSDAITTVSPTYAEELLTPEFGMGLDGLLRSRADVLTGILNGVDPDDWAPPYDDPEGKAPHRAALRAEVGLPDADGPLCVVVSRLTGQKGLDLLADAMPTLLARGGQLALLGSGEAALEARFAALARTEPGVAVRFGYDEGLARRLIAGGDAILVPSRFEPCGLTQLYGLRFGTVPVVAFTGGLADTIVPASPAGLRAGAATGLQVHPLTATGLSRALEHLCDLHADPETWRLLQRNGMAHPVGWDRAAADYAALYARLDPQGGQAAPS